MKAVDTIDQKTRAILSSKFLSSGEFKNDSGEILFVYPSANCYQRGSTGVCFTGNTAGTEFSPKDSLIAWSNEAMVAKTGEWESSIIKKRGYRFSPNEIENFIVIENSTLLSLPSQTALKNLCNLYEIRSLKEVETFLNNNIYLETFLFKAYLEIKKYFSEEKIQVINIKPEY